MKTIQRIILLFILLPQMTYGGNPDSLIEVQIKKTTKYYREVRNLTKEIGNTNTKLGEYLNSNESINNKIDNLDSNILLNRQRINELNSLPKEEPKKKFSWLEFFSNLFIEIAGAFVGAFAAIWIFYNQIKLDKKKEIEKKIEEQKENNFYLNSLIEATLTKVSEQRDAIKKFYEEIESNPVEVPLISLTPMQDLKRLAKVVDKDIYYYSFLEEFGKTKETADKYRKITVSVDYLDSAIIQMEDVLWKGLQFDRERKLKFKQSFEDGMDMANEFAKRFEQNNANFSNTIYKYIALYHKATEEQKSDFNWILNNYITPLKTELVKGFSNMQEARHIITNLKQLTFTYSDIVRCNKRHTEPFKEFYERFGKAIEKIKENSKELKEKNSLQQSAKRS